MFRYSRIELAVILLEKNSDKKNYNKKEKKLKTLAYSACRYYRQILRVKRS